MLVLDIELLRGRYPAAAWTNVQLPEWPPHPARAFCGLVAIAKSDEEWAALRWLECQPAPEVWASRTTFPIRRSGYVVTNARSNKGGSQFHPGRQNASLDRVSTQPASSRINLVWRDISADEHLETLRGLARRLPYLGRSDGAVLADAREDFTPSADQIGYEPGPITSPLALRVLYAGYVDELQSQYEAGRPAWEVGRERGYVPIGHAVYGPAAAVESPFAELLVLRFAGIKPGGGLAVALSLALRQSVMSVVPNPLPPALHGHDPDIRHVAFLALPNFGGFHANGDLLALGVALPRLDSAERRQIIHGILSRVADEQKLTVRLNTIGEIELSYLPELRSPHGATAERWTRPSDEWVTATPIVLDRHPKREGDIDAIIKGSFETAGYPAPVAIEVSPTPLMAGGLTPRSQDLPKWLKGRVILHVRARFDQRLSGPMLVGAGRYLGIGLLAPTSEAGDR